MGAVTKTTRRCSSCRRHRASSAFSLPLSPSRLRHPPPSGEHPEWLGGNARSEAGSYGMPRGREVASEGRRRRSSESQLERKKERLLLCWRGNYVAAVFAFVVVVFCVNFCLNRIVLWFCTLGKRFWVPCCCVSVLIGPFCVSA